MMPPYPFSDLPELDEKTTGFHGIIMALSGGKANLKYFALQLREITQQACYIYTRGQEKSRYLRELLFRNII